VSGVWFSLLSPNDVAGFFFLDSFSQNVLTHRLNHLDCFAFQLVWLNATKPIGKVSPLSERQGTDTWEKPPNHKSAATPKDPFDIHATTKSPPHATHQPSHAAGAPSKPDFYDPFDKTSEADMDLSSRSTLAPLQGFNARSPPPFVPTQHTSSPATFPGDDE
jgi:hypothetical protein